MAELTVLIDGIEMGESPRWHDGRLWFCDWLAHEVRAVDLDGRVEVMAHVDALPFSIDWLADGTLVVVAGTRVLRREPEGTLVRDLFDRIYPAVAELGAEGHVAAEFGESKPDRDVYLDACAALGVDPARTAFVDDKAANADGAASAGLRSHHFTGVDRLVDFLRDLGLDPAQP